MESESEINIWNNGVNAIAKMMECEMKLENKLQWGL